MSDLDFLSEESGNRHSKYYKKKKKQLKRENAKKARIKQRNKNRVRRVQAMWAIMILVFVAAGVGGFLLLSNKSGKGKAQKNTESQQTTTLKQDGGELLDTNNKQVLDIVNQYFDAKKKGDTDQLSKIVDSVPEEEAERAKQEIKYIEDYQNINVYTKEGLEDGSFVAYVYYEMKFVNIKTAAPGSIVLYLKPKEDQSGLMIHTYAKDSDVISYIKNLEQKEDVKKFYNTVEAKLVEACDSDGDLKTFYQELANTN